MDVPPLLFSLQLLSLGVADKDSDSVVKQLTTLARRQVDGDGGSSSLSELLGLAVCMFSLVGDDCLDQPSEETELKVNSRHVYALIS